MSERPPLGLKPKFIWDEERLAEIEAAIERYAKAGGTSIPEEWLREREFLKVGISSYHYLINYINADGHSRFKVGWFTDEELEAFVSSDYKHTVNVTFLGQRKDK